MQDALVHLLEHNLAYYQQAAILLAALIMAHFIPLYRQQQPLFLFARLAKQFAVHVNHPQRAISQRKIAGFLSVLLLTLPFALLIYFFIALAYYPWFFEFLILYLCLQDSRLIKDSNRIAQLSHQQEKHKARMVLADWTSRDTSSLTTLGINKATIETTISVTQTNFTGVILAFLLGGAPLVLVYKMLQQLDEAWPNIAPRFNGFNSYLHTVLAILNFFPKLLFSAFFAISAGCKGFSLWVNTAFSPQSFTTALVSYRIIAFKFGIELGGPQLFDGIKVQQPKYQYGKPPTAEHIVLINQKISQFQFFTIALTLAITVLFPFFDFAIR
ncbi:cobalamin biosynthesis protein CobD/CbiB [Parashewanella tropica]|uniref:cobalamin biosynthesis protein CobD/CbiB n=1 Tax=Parashewanella tropica TaxID=2547970 RepID=UPI0010599EDF|nr:cobalamin biosynthesis protein [Parashewanella tropica]